MIYRSFGRLGYQVSAVGMGCWNIGNQWGHMTDAEAGDIIKAALDGGVNLFDTAESYGDPHGISEIRVGNTIKSLGIARDKLFFVSKIGSWGFRQGEQLPNKTPDSIRLSGHAICGRLKTDYIDVLLCHKATIEDPSAFIEGFDALEREGFIRSYGISTNSLEVLKRFYDMSGGKCAVLEADYSLINKQPEEELLPFCQEHGIAVLVRGPLAQGILSGRFTESTVFKDDVRSKWNEGQPGRQDFLDKLALAREAEKTVNSFGGCIPLAEAAIRYTISHPAAPVAIPGMTSPQQARQNAAVGDELFAEKEWAKL
ncbi:MAG: aldo/keto reductase [Christensenellales bacterium]|jgi:myo-inositol catabolism protein IolS